MSWISQHSSLYCFFWSKHANSIKQHFQRRFCFHKEKNFVVKYSVITFSEEKISTFSLEILFHFEMYLLIEEKKKADFFKILLHKIVNI